jgi:hypothetical protein
LQALAGSRPIAQLARHHQVSRQFLYRQADTARLALDHAFDPTRPDEEILFHLPVTRPWLPQLVLALVLSCHSPYRGAIALRADLFDTDIALGTVHNTVQAAVAPARQINGSYDLASVRVGAHDEIFKAGRPVLVGVDTASTFGDLLSQEERRDAETWGVRRLEVAECGFAPRPSSPTSAPASAPARDWRYPRSPVAATSSIWCAISSRPPRTWRTGPTTRSRPARAWSGSRPVSGGGAGPPEPWPGA